MINMSFKFLQKIWMVAIISNIAIPIVWLAYVICLFIAPQLLLPKISRTTGDPGEAIGLAIGGAIAGGIIQAVTLELWLLIELPILLTGVYLAFSKARLAKALAVSGVVLQVLLTLYILVNW